MEIRVLQVASSFTSIPIAQTLLPLVVNAGLRIYEVGIGYWGRTYEEGKKIGWKDGVRALWCLLKYSAKEPVAPVATEQKSLTTTPARDHDTQD